MSRVLSSLFGLVFAASSALAEPLPPVDPAALPLAADQLVAVRTFSLDQARPYPWMKGHGPIRQGLLVTLDVEPALCQPRQMAEPVVYVGGVPAERLAADPAAGRLLLLVPGWPDLAAVPVHFGLPDLPERIDAQQGQEALASAISHGIRPFTSEQVQQAQLAGGPAMELADSETLDLAIASWIEAWTPDESDRADGLRAPPVGLE